MNAHEIADRLNELHALDPEAVERLMEHEVPAGDGLARHPAVQVGLGDPLYTVRLIGIINALTDDENGVWRVAMKIDDDGGLAGFTAVHAPRVASGPVTYADCAHCDGHVFQSSGGSWDHVPIGPDDARPRHPAEPDRSTLTTTHPAETPERAT